MVETLPLPTSSAHRPSPSTAGEQAPEAASPSPDGLFLAFDATSPTVSLALGSRVGTGGRILAERRAPLRRSGARILGWIDQMLEQAGAELTDLEGVLCLRGPGSFNGLRVGMATALGLRTGLGLPVGVVDTLPVLATAALQTIEALEKRTSEADPQAHSKPGPAVEGSSRAGSILAVIDALRGEWHAQEFARVGGGVLEAIAPPRLASSAELLRTSTTVVGFGLDALTSAAAEQDLSVRCIEVDALAPAMLRIAAGPRSASQESDPALSWDPNLLSQPRYLREPFVTLPKKPAGAPMTEAAALEKQERSKKSGRSDLDSSQSKP